MGWKARRPIVGFAKAEARSVRASPLRPNCSDQHASLGDEPLFDSDFTYLLIIVRVVKNGKGRDGVVGKRCSWSFANS